MEKIKYFMKSFSYLFIIPYCSWDSLSLHVLPGISLPLSYHIEHRGVKDSHLQTFQLITHQNSIQTCTIYVHIYAYIKHKSIYLFLSLQTLDLVSKLPCILYTCFWFYCIWRGSLGYQLSCKTGRAIHLFSWTTQLLPLQRFAFVINGRSFILFLVNSQVNFCFTMNIT